MCAQRTKLLCRCRRRLRCCLSICLLFVPFNIVAVRTLKKEREYRLQTLLFSISRKRDSAIKCQCIAHILLYVEPRSRGNEKANCKFISYLAFGFSA